MGGGGRGESAQGEDGLVVRGGRHRAHRARAARCARMRAVGEGDAAKTIGPAAASGRPTILRSGLVAAANWPAAPVRGSQQRLPSLLAVGGRALG